MLRNDNSLKFYSQTTASRATYFPREIKYIDL